MNGRELESGGHHYPKDFRRGLPPECSVTYSPSLESPPLVAARLACYREIEGIRHPTRRAPPHPRRIRCLVFEIRIFIRRTGRAEPRRMVPRFCDCNELRRLPNEPNSCGNVFHKSHRIGKLAVQLRYRTSQSYRSATTGSTRKARRAGR